MRKYYVLTSAFSQRDSSPNYRSGNLQNQINHMLIFSIYPFSMSSISTIHVRDAKMTLHSSKFYILSPNTKRKEQHAGNMRILNTGIQRFLKIVIHISYDRFLEKIKCSFSKYFFIIIMPQNFFGKIYNLKNMSYFLFIMRRYGMKYEKFNRYKAVQICILFQMLYNVSNGFAKIMSLGN